MNYLSRKCSVIFKIAINDPAAVYSTFVQLAVPVYPVRMKLSLFPVTLLLNKAKNKKRRRGGRSNSAALHLLSHLSSTVFRFTNLLLSTILIAERARCSKTGPNHRGKMDAVSLKETENNDSTSSTSCVNEFET